MPLSTAEESANPLATHTFYIEHHALNCQRGSSSSLDCRSARGEASLEYRSPAERCEGLVYRRKAAKLGPISGSPAERSCVAGGK
ncbi:hypothetical protein PoB_003674500 [Plakobranchus ocellatus]|uniref:Uncharacterized protein n=1 Tax=Plakobranchus ocellatus TaxID=259542 RepID=A0AAV4APP7_9GAST|nr:hypothetical protein PoB_003674500 [Plakobranchus ocellatus]